MATTFQVEMDWNRDGTWIDESSRARSVKIRLGFEKPLDPVAAVGTCTITLDNSTRRFSPANESGALAGKLLPRRPVRISASSGGSTWVLFRGWIEKLLPTAGSGECFLTCIDGVALLERQQVSAAYESTKTVQAAVLALVYSAYTPPAADISGSGESLSHYGRNWNPESTTVLDALREVCQAVAGRFFIGRDGTAIFRSRADLQNPSVAAALTIDDTSALEDLNVVVDVNQVVNECDVTVYPVETVSAEQVIWKARAVLRIAPGQTRVFYANFRDSDGQRCGAVEVVTPAATTDYTVNDRSDGSGFNYTADPAFSISTVTEATRLKITLGNTATGPLYVTLLQVRGKPLRVYDPITVQKVDSASQDTYEKRSRSFDLPMQPDPVFGQSMANYWVGRYKNPALQVDHLLARNRDVLGGVDLFGLGLFDKVLINNSESGGLGHWITSLDYTIDPDGFRVRMGLERADDRQYWLLGRTGYTELGRTTRIGF